MDELLTLMYADSIRARVAYPAIGSFGCAICHGVTIFYSAIYPLTRARSDITHEEFGIGLGSPSRLRVVSAGAQRSTQPVFPIDQDARRRVLKCHDVPVLLTGNKTVMPTDEIMAAGHAIFL